MKSLNVLLSCSYGFSTSILTEKMSEYFKEKNYPFTVEALPETTALNNIEKYDVVLIGPQVAYLRTKFEKALAGSKPVYVMESRPYGLQQVDVIVEKMLTDMKDDGFYE